MKFLMLLSILLSVLVGIARGVDLAVATNAATGLCTVGSVWWRYAALGIAVLAAVLIGRHCAGKAENLCRRRPLAGVLAFAAAVCLLAGGAAQALLTVNGLADMVRVVLQVLCAVWLSSLCRRWLTAGRWQTPAGGLPLAVAGSVLFYWNVLMRFMENSSSWHRVGPTAAVWQMLAALLFLAALARALYLPEPGNGKALCASGLAAFALCLCWQLPQTVQLAVQGSASELLTSLAVCCIGALGGVCAAACAAAAKH